MARTNGAHPSARLRVATDDDRLHFVDAIGRFLTAVAGVRKSGARSSDEERIRVELAGEQSRGERKRAMIT